MPIFSGLRLVGGTGLALQFGHRKSIDIDLFGTLIADEFAMTNELAKLGAVSVIKSSQNIHIYSINGIKVDLVNFIYPWLEDLIVEDGIRIAHVKDIGALKMAAIAGRGTKKDFIDLYFLLQHYSLKELIGFYNAKYHDGSEFLVLKSLTYFEDANPEIEPLMLTPVPWVKIREEISRAQREYLN